MASCDGLFYRERSHRTQSKRIVWMLQVLGFSGNVVGGGGCVTLVGMV